MSTIEYEIIDNVAYITLNRPEKLNAINADMRDELFQTFRDFETNPEAWIAVITGRGRAFCVGHDLEEMTTPSESNDKASIEDLYVLQSRIWKPIIAAINGFCLAQGGGIALASDIRIMSDRARIGWPQAKRGLSSISGPSMLSSRIPMNYALEFLYTGEFIDAPEALRLHLVNKVVPHDDLMSVVKEYVQKLSENAPLAMRAVKEAMVTGQHKSLEDRVQIASDLFYKVQETEDAREGLRAFSEKRKPVFKGR